MDREFYEEHRGSRCPDRLFSSDVRKIKKSIDAAMDRYERTVTPDEIEALFMANNPTLTTAQKASYTSLFGQIKREQPMGGDVAQEVLSKLFQQVIGEDIANLGFDNAGHLIEIGARPNTGKTSFHASLIASPGGFAHQGANCIILCNEEGYHRVGARYLTAATGMTMQEIKANPSKARDLYAPVKERIKIKDATGRDMNWVESVCKAYKPDLVLLDMGDKFAKTGGFARLDEALKANAIHARMIAKQHNCAMFYMSQLSADAEGKIILNQSMMEGSRTGKAAEADLMILIAKNPPVQGQDEEDVERHLNVVKNKLTGWHGSVHCQLEYQTARYTA